MKDIEILSNKDFYPILQINNWENTVLIHELPRHSPERLSQCIHINCENSPQELGDKITIVGMALVTGMLVKARSAT